MKLLVGLGNPGPKHAGQRHNIGFMALDEIADRHGLGPWRTRWQGEVAEGRLGPDKVVLLKPQTFMNLSGQSVGEAMRYLKLSPDDVWVFHDELDLAPGKMRLKAGGGHAGHNGLRSIHQHIGEGYRRVRLGIGHPGRKEAVAGYVLHDFAKADEAWLRPLLDEIGRAADRLVAGDEPGFMNAVAQAVAPPKPKPAPKPRSADAADPKPAPREGAAPGETSAGDASPRAPGSSAPAPAAETPPGDDRPPSLLDRLQRHFSRR